MKTTIYINGQINGNFALRGAIITSNCEENRTMFNGFSLTFQTKKEAKKALWEGYKYLRADKEDAQKSRLSYIKGCKVIYDASQAEIR